MANRRPLVIKDGQLQQLQAGDALDAPFSALVPGTVPLSGGGTANFLRADGAWAPPGGGPGGASITAVTVNVPSPTLEETINVVDGAVTALMKAIVTWGAVTADSENDPAMDNIRISAVCNAGSIDITLSADDFFVGDFQLNYMVA